MSENEEFEFRRRREAEQAAAAPSGPDYEEARKGPLPYQWAKQAAEQFTKDPGGFVQTGLESMANVPSLNYYPEIVAKMRHYSGANPGMSEDQIRDMVVNRMAKGAQEFPMADVGGKLTGAAAQYRMLAPLFKKLLPAALGVKSYATNANLLSRAARAGTVNAGQAAIQNPNHTDNPDDPWKLKDRAMNALIAAPIGFATQKVADDFWSPSGSAQVSFTDLANRLRGTAYERAAKVTGANNTTIDQWRGQGPGSKNADPVVTDRRRAIGKQLLDPQPNGEPLVGWFTSTPQLAERLEPAIQDLGQKIEGIIDGKGLGDMKQFIQGLPVDKRIQLLKDLSAAGYSPEESAKEVWKMMQGKYFRNMSRSDVVSSRNRVQGQLGQHGRLREGDLTDAADVPLYPPEYTSGPYTPKDPKDPFAYSGRFRTNPLLEEGAPLPATSAPDTFSGGPDVPIKHVGVKDSQSIPGMPDDKIFNLRNLIGLKRRLRNVQPKAWAASPPEITHGVEADMQLGDRVQKATENIADVLDEASGGKLGDLASTNRQQGNLLEANKAAFKKVSRISANEDTGLLDTITGAGAGIATGLADTTGFEKKGNSANPGTWGGRMAGFFGTKYLGGKINEAKRAYGASFSARSNLLGAGMADKASKMSAFVEGLLTSDPSKLGRYSRILRKAYDESPEAFNATVYSLTIGRPDFGEILEQAQMAPDEQPIMDQQQRQQKFEDGLKGQ